MLVAIRSSRSGQLERKQSHHWILATILNLAAVTIASRIPTARAFCQTALAFASASSKSFGRNHHNLQRGFTKSFYDNKTQREIVTTRMASTSSSSSSYDIPTTLRGLFAGSGVEGLSNPFINEQILNLLPPAKQTKLKDVNVLYLGTATYDIPVFRERQTARFLEKNCRVSHLNLATDPCNIQDCVQQIRSADILLVGGGNTLFAVDRWHHLGLVPYLHEAMQNGCILTGGSAGAICWFDSGHSDSADPETYQEAMLQKYMNNNNNNNNNSQDESSGDYDPNDKKEWKYLRCPGLGFVPGPMVCCPHHDKVQSNGLLRAHDFDQMLLAKAKSSKTSVLGIGIDHYAAFIVTGDTYRVYAIPEKPGSISNNDQNEGFFDVSEDGTPNGRPGVWIKRVIVDESGGPTKVEAMVCPPTGKLTDLLAYGGDYQSGPNHEGHDENQAAVDKCRRENPSGRQFGV